MVNHLKNVRINIYRTSITTKALTMLMPRYLNIMNEIVLKKDWLRIRASH